MIIITRHSKGPEGWAQFKSAPAGSKAWDSADRQWIDWLINNGQTVVTIGHDMYQLTNTGE